MLHGSRGRGHAGPGFNVDLAVILRADLSPTERWRKRLRLLELATSALGTDAVDLLILEDRERHAAMNTIGIMGGFIGPNVMGLVP